MQQKLSDLLFQEPEIFFGAIEQDELEENEVDLDWGLIFDARALPQNISSTGLFFHWH